MLLAGILALCMLSGAPSLGSASGMPHSASTDSPTPQSPNSGSNPTPQASTQSQNPSPQTPTSQTSSPSNDKTQPPKKPKPKKKPAQPAPDANDAPPKKVVTHGGTESPSTHLAPKMSDEQTAKSRADNADLINAAAANLEKVGGRSLTSEQKETEEQVRKFMEQSKVADQEGDLQRAGTLANKAKLLSDSLEETSRPK